MCACDAEGPRNKGCILYLSVKLDCVSLIGLPVLVLQKIISD